MIHCHTVEIKIREQLKNTSELISEMLLLHCLKFEGIFTIGIPLF